MTGAAGVDAPGCGCDAAALSGALIPLDEALRRVAGAVLPVQGAETVALGGALGRVLAAPVRARAAMPPFDNSAMDGYALDTRTLSGDGPWRLVICGRIPAGGDAEALVPGQAARIFTGAPVPPGANAVIMQEEVAGQAGEILFSRRPKPGQNIRREGEELAREAMILEAGQRLDARAIAACASGGHGELSVRRRLRVALIVTGDELTPPGQDLSGAGIWDVNTATLQAVLASPDVLLTDTRHCADSRAGLRETLAELSETTDLIVTSGAVSVGEEDHVKPALASLGARTLFSGVAIKPGKPVSVGHVGRAVWLGLPGNPLSAYVTWQVIGRAVLSRLSGQTCRDTRRRLVVAGQVLRHKPGRCELRLARLSGHDDQGREIARSGAATHSARVAQLADADGVLLIPAEAEELPQGGLVEFLPFNTC